MLGVRVLALGLLAALALLNYVSPTEVAGLRHLVFDAYQRIFPLERTSHPVTIVVIDEAALTRFGQWPWPRTRVADLVTRIAQHRPSAIGIDILFPDSDRFSPAIMANDLVGLPPPLAKWLSAQPSTDERFAQVISGKPVVLGIVGGDADPRFGAPPTVAPARIKGELKLTDYRGHLGNMAAIDRAAAGRGLVNMGRVDQVVRQVPLVATVQGVVVPSLGVEALRVAQGARLLSLSATRGGFLELRVGEAGATLQRDGITWLRVGPHDPDRFVSAFEVMSGRANPEYFRDKIVLVGLFGVGLFDFKTTPLGEFVAGVELHAQVIENLYNGVSLRRSEYAQEIETAILIACGILVVLFVPRLSALEGANLVIGVVVLLVGAGLIAFHRYGWLFDPAGPAIGTLAVFGAVVVGTLSVTERQRRVLRDQAARMAGEVDAARRIQMGLLPNPQDTVGSDGRIALAAFLEPARTVGGDFYDCFRIDANRIFVVVADVSGKGLPAALFMAAVKSHIKSHALTGDDVGTILDRVQADVARENPEQLFITAFAAILDASTGLLTFANAGHEPPFVRRPNGAPERLGRSGGPPLCAVEDFTYPTGRRTLSPGEWVCVLTDGVTEAMNPKKEFFGAERVRAALGWLPADVDPAELVARLREEVRRFSAGAEAADDLTLLALRWNGK